MVYGWVALAEGPRQVRGTIISPNFYGVKDIPQEILR